MSAQLSSAPALSSADEVLLWARQLRKEHSTLAQRMNTLEEQHQAYDAKLRSTVAIAEGMEAATYRIQQLEQKLDAVIEDEQQRPFEIYAGPKITELDKSIESIRRRQQGLALLEGRCLSLENAFEKASSGNHQVDERVQAIEVSLRQLRQAPTQAPQNNPDDVKGLLQRIEVIEGQRKQDVRQVKAMQEDMASLKKTCENYATENDNLRTRLAHVNGFSRTDTHSTPVSQATTIIATTPSATRQLPIAPKPYVQVPRSPPVKERNLESVHKTSPTANKTGELNQDRKRKRVKEELTHRGLQVQAKVPTTDTSQKAVQQPDNSQQSTQKAGRRTACDNCRRRRRRCIHDAHGNVDPNKANRTSMPKALQRDNLNSVLRANPQSEQGLRRPIRNNGDRYSLRFQDELGPDYVCLEEQTPRQDTSRTKSPKKVVASTSVRTQKPIDLETPSPRKPLSLKTVSPEKPVVARPPSLKGPVANKHVPKQRGTPAGTDGQKSKRATKKRRVIPDFEDMEAFLAAELN